jgi:anaerobic magnesium-protoporphyrin IX monomethyl ester cyclase
MSDVLLVHAEDSFTKGFVGSMPPLGLAWLATSLHREGLSVRILDPQVEEESFDDVFADERPSVLGVSVTTAARFRAFEYVRRAKELDPKTLTVLGGPHVTCCAQDTLKHLPELDAVVRGEGEIPFTEICMRQMDGQPDFSGIGSLSWRRDAEVLHNGNGSRVKDLDSLGFPARDLLANDLYELENEFLGTKSFHLMASRGCPYQCSFCSAGAIWDHRVTFRSPGHGACNISSVNSVAAA